MTGCEKEECVSSHLPSPLQSSVHPGCLQNCEERHHLRPQDTLLQYEAPLLLLGVSPGCPLALQTPGAVHVGPGACWSVHQPKAGLSGQTVLKPGKQKQK